MRQNQVPTKCFTTLQSTIFSRSFVFSPINRATPWYTVMSQSKSSNSSPKPKRVRWYFKLHLRSEPHEHVFFGEPTTHATSPYLISINSKSKDIELDPFQDVDEESGWWFLLATSNENLNYRLQNTSEQGHRRANKPRNFPVKGQLSLSLYYEKDTRSAKAQLAENKIKKSKRNASSADEDGEQKDDEENSKESESEIIGNAEEIGQISEKNLTDTDAEEILDTKDMFTAYQLPLEDYSITLDPDLAETASPPKSKKRPTRTCQVEFTRQKKGLCGAFHIDFQRSEGKTDHCVALFDNDTIVAIRLFVPMAYLPEEFKKEHEDELMKKQTRKIKFLEEDKLVEVHFINNKLAPAYHMSQDGIVDEKVQEVIEPERMTVPELKELLKDRNLPTEGVKKDLVKRLTAALNIGTCFKTEEESKSEDTNGKKSSKKKTAKSSKKKTKTVEKLDAIAEDEEEESVSPNDKNSDESKENEVEIKEEAENKSKTKSKGKKKAPKKKKGGAKKAQGSEEKKESADDTDKNESPGSQEDIMGSPIFPSALYNDDKMTDVQSDSSAIEATIEVTEPSSPKKSTPKKGKSPKKSPAKKIKDSNATEASPETESDSGVSGSQGSSQGSNGEKSSASPEEPKNSTPKRTPKKGRGKKSPSKTKSEDEPEHQIDKMEVEEKNDDKNDGPIVSSQNSDKSGSQEIASSSPKKKGQKRKREEAETSNDNKIELNDSNVPVESNGSEEQEPQPKRRRLSRSKDEVLQSTPPQSLTQSL